MLFAIASVTQMFFDQVEDIQDLVNAFVTVRHHWFGPDNADEHVRSAFSVIRRAGVEYRRWLEDLHKGDRAQIIIGLILPTPGNKARLERLRAKLVRCVEAAKDAQASFASRKAFEMQCEQLSLQKTINGNLDMLLPYQMTEISHIRAQQAVLPITAGEQPCEVAGSSKKWKHIWKKT